MRATLYKGFTKSAASISIDVINRNGDKALTIPWLLEIETFGRNFEYANGNLKPSCGLCLPNNHWKAAWINS